MKNQPKNNDLSPNLDKERAIKKEHGKLKKIYKNIDKNKLTVLESLLKNAAWTIVTLDELQKIIDEEGYTETYQNGANQTGKKQSEAVKTHIAMTKNLVSIIKSLSELVPEVKTDNAILKLRDM